jgi:hypothetical protein
LGAWWEPSAASVLHALARRESLFWLIIKIHDKSELFDIEIFRVWAKMPMHEDPQLMDDAAPG